MKIEFPVEKTIRARQSVRTYDRRSLSNEIIDKINDYISKLENPFQVDVSFHLVETSLASQGEKLGTYGVIKGVQNFVGASVVPGEFALEALGYSFEKLILYMTSLGLGTCWLGGTFNRSGFTAAMKLKDNELFPAISPIGYSIGKKRPVEVLARWAAKADKRKEWNDIFFNHDFITPLKREDAKEYEFPLEMLRLAPSAMNKQPWKIVRGDEAWHFYEVVPKKVQAGIEIQRVDIGIAACHFHMAALEKNLSGKFQKLTNIQLKVPDELKYIFSYSLDR